MSRTVLDPPYRRLVQQPMFCAAASVQMVLFRHGHWFDQEVIATALGTTVRKSQASYYGRKFPTAANDDLARLGARLIRLDRKLNRFFARHQLPFTASVVRTSKIPDLHQLLSDELARNHDVIVNYWVVNEPPRTSMGHFTSVAAITKRTVIVADPYPQHPPTWTMKLATLRERMDDRWDGNERGVVLIRPSGFVLQHPVVK